MENPYALAPGMKLIIRTSPLPEPTHPAHYEPGTRCDTFDCIDFDRGYIRMTDGSLLPIVSLLDELGDRTADPEEAVTLIAHWYEDVTFVVDLTTLPEAMTSH